MLSRLRESWLVPAALLVLAVAVLAWLLVPAVWGGGDSAEEPVSSQPEVAQTPPEEPPQAEDPGVEGRNVASYAAFENKDPFGSRAGLAEEPEDEAEEPDPDQQTPEREQNGTEPGEQPEGDPGAQREREARDAASGQQDSSGADPEDDDFSVLEAAEGERGPPQDGAQDSGAPVGGDPVGGDPAAGGPAGSGGVGGDGPGGGQEAFQNGGGPGGPSK